jgi:hypothetical protein
MLKTPRTQSKLTGLGAWLRHSTIPLMLAIKNAIDNASTNFARRAQDLCSNRNASRCFIGWCTRFGPNNPSRSSRLVQSFLLTGRI